MYAETHYNRTISLTGMPSYATIRPMNLFSPDRPRLSNGTRALLLDNSAVPQVIAIPIENNRVHLAVMVRDHTATTTEPYAYHWKETEVPFSQLEIFFKHYVDDPEDALLSYFQWTDTVPLATKAKVIPIRPNQTQPTTVTDVLNDLL
jgi:hypothetical protein